MNRDTARLIVHGDTAEIFTPFEALDIIRSLPSRTWSPEAKAWSIRTAYVDLAVTALSSAGYQVFVTRPDGTPWSSSRRRTPPSSSSSTITTWVDQAFAACPPANTARLRKSLLSVFHPDVGGDADTTRRIITAAERSS